MTGPVGDSVERAAALLADHVARDVAIGPLTTYRVGGPAALFCRVETDEDLAAVASAVSESGVPVLVVGRGSNLLVSDAGFPGLAVVLGEAYERIEIDGPTVRAGGAVSLPVLARKTAAAGLTGLEWAVGVPGSVGGAVRMNAGGHGSDTRAVVRRVRVVDLVTRQDEVVAAADLDLRYRHSAVRPQQVIAWAEFELRPGDRATAEAEISDIVRWRRENQPGGQNAGSVFTNPAGDSAGRLIESCGLKGHRRGTATVSEKHANFFQADPEGSADDVLELIREVRRLVHERTGVLLEPELRLVGFVPNAPFERPSFDD